MVKPSVDTRKPYGGNTRSLVIAIDVGTTFSGVSYAFLVPSEIPKIIGVTQFPGQENVYSNHKIPSIMYYDSEGRVMAAGAEAVSDGKVAQAEDEEWIKAELFKLRLRPRTMKLNMNGMRLSPLPKGKTALHVFGDFLAYLFRCTRAFITDTHANGAVLWNQVQSDIQFVLSHPNGWEGAQQTKMRRSAIYGGLIPDTNEGKARIRFVTEGEASLHACVQNGLAADVFSSPSKHGFLIADAGGGTLDISSYAIRSIEPLTMEEIAPPDCIFAGSVFVSRRARDFLAEKLKGSKYGSTDAVEHITKRFDETTKQTFRSKDEHQYIKFGSPLDKDPAAGIRNGQLKLLGVEVASLFELSVAAAFDAIKAQIDASNGVIKSVFLVGGYAASPWLFGQLSERLTPLGVTVSKPDTQTSKAVADGAIGFYCDHHVSARMSKFMYGVEFLRELDPQDPDHIARRDRLCELPSGPKLLPDAFDCILARGVKVKESSVFSRKYCTELTSLTMLSVFEVEVWCYRAGNEIPKWINRQAEDFSTLCVVQADLFPLSSSAEAKTGPNGKKYWTIVFSVEIHFGLTEFKARIKWVDAGRIIYGPASIIYNERGHRADEDDEPDAYPEDDPVWDDQHQRSSPTSRPVSHPVSRSASRARSHYSPDITPSPTSQVTPTTSIPGGRNLAYEMTRSINGDGEVIGPIEAMSSVVVAAATPEWKSKSGAPSVRTSPVILTHERERDRERDREKKREREWKEVHEREKERLLQQEREAQRRAQEERAREAEARAEQRARDKEERERQRREEREHLQRERKEYERLERERIEGERVTLEQLERERLAREEEERARELAERERQAELGRQELERAQQERKAREQEEYERQERERLSLQEQIKEDRKKQREVVRLKQQERIRQQAQEREEKQRQAAKAAQLMQEEAAKKAEEARLAQLEKAALEEEERARAEAERIATLEAQRIKEEEEKARQAEAARLAQEEVVREAQEAARLAEEETKRKVEASRVEKKRLANESKAKAKADRLAEIAEKERLQKEAEAKAEAERLERERLKAERSEKERLQKEAEAKAEAERLERERLEVERSEQERLERERLKREQLEKEHEEAEKRACCEEEEKEAERQRLEKQHLDAKAKAEQERLEEEARIEREHQEVEAKEKERQEAEAPAEKERLEVEEKAKEEAKKKRMEVTKGKGKKAGLGVMSNFATELEASTLTPLTASTTLTFAEKMERLKKKNTAPPAPALEGIAETQESAEANKEAKKTPEEIRPPSAKEEPVALPTEAEKPAPLTPGTSNAPPSILLAQEPAVPAKVPEPPQSASEPAKAEEVPLNPPPLPSATSAARSKPSWLNRTSPAEKKTLASAFSKPAATPAPAPVPAQEPAVPAKAPEQPRSIPEVAKMEEVPPNLHPPPSATSGTTPKPSWLKGSATEKKTASSLGKPAAAPVLAPATTPANPSIRPSPFVKKADASWESTASKPATTSASGWGAKSLWGGWGSNFAATPEHKEPENTGSASFMGSVGSGISQTIDAVAAEKDDSWNSDNNRSAVNLTDDRTAPTRSGDAPQGGAESTPKPHSASLPADASNELDASGADETRAETPVEIARKPKKKKKSGK